MLGVDHPLRTARTRAAVVHGLVDEIERVMPSGGVDEALGAQWIEELARLSRAAVDLSAQLTARWEAHEP